MALDNNVASEIMQYHIKKENHAVSQKEGNLTFPQIIFLKDRQMGEHSLIQSESYENTE